MGQLSFSLEQNILKDILHGRDEYEIRNYTLLSLSQNYVLLSNDEQQKWGSFYNSYGKQKFYLFVNVLKQFKDHRLSDCHPTTLIDGKDANATDILNIIQTKIKR